MNHSTGALIRRFAPYFKPYRGVLALDPRPAYQDDPQRLYGVAFAGKNVRFTVKDGTLTVRAVEDLEK